jgi:hypothetical protein
MDGASYESHRRASRVALAAVPVQAYASRCRGVEELRLTWKRVFTAAAIVGLVAAAAHAQSTDVMVGTWKLNPGKSTTTFRSATTVVEAAGKGIKTTVDLVAGDGTPYHFTWSAKYDGRDNRVRGVSPYGSGVHVIALTRVNPRTAKVVTKLNGKVTITQTLVVSDDGRTRTITTTGKDAKGRAIESTAVYEKQ